MIIIIMITRQVDLNCQLLVKSLTLPNNRPYDNNLIKVKLMLKS